MDNKEILEAVFSLPESDGRFEGRLGAVAHILSLRRPALLLAFAPKAAGTFFRTAAIQALDGQLIRVGHAQGGRDAQPYLPTFVAYYLDEDASQTMVAHAHMQALPANRHFIEAFDLKPVIMIRPIPDMLASYWDMLESDGAARASGVNCRIPDRFLDMTRDAKADFLVDMAGPWYASYFSTWLSYAEEDPNRICILRYREFLLDPGLILCAALKHAGVARSLEICTQAVGTTWDERHTFRFNKGVVGRGREYFSGQQTARLERMLGYYDIANETRRELMGFETAA